MRACPACGDPVAAILHCCPRCDVDPYSRPYSGEPAPKGPDPYRADRYGPGSPEPGQYQPDWYQPEPDEPESFGPEPYSPDPGEWEESGERLLYSPPHRRPRAPGRWLPRPGPWAPRRLRVSGPWPDPRPRVSIPWPPRGRLTQAASAALTALALLAGPRPSGPSSARSGGPPRPERNWLATGRQAPVPPGRHRPGGPRFAPHRPQGTRL